jgi:hypothetical protein
VSIAYFVFSEALEPNHPTAEADLVCKICRDLGFVDRLGLNVVEGIESDVPGEPIPIDVPPPPAEPPENPFPEPELFITI